MSRRRIVRLLTVLALYASAPAQAAQPLDDSASPRQRVTAQTEWLERVPGRHLSEERFNTLVARVPGLEVRLNTAAYVGQNARIYLRLPATLPGADRGPPLRLSWRARGGFLSGETELGQRGLIYEGPVTEAQMADVFDFTVLLDARSHAESLNLDLSYEIETQ